MVVQPRSLDWEEEFGELVMRAGAAEETQVSGRGLSKLKGGIRKMRGGASPPAGAEEPQVRELLIMFDTRTHRLRTY